MNRFIRGGLIAIALLLVGIGTGLWFRYDVSRDAAKRSTCNGGMCGITTAMHNYLVFNQDRFPPAYLLGPDGKPWHSWRVLLLPFLSEDALYKEYKFDEPWNEPNNSKLATRMPKIYGCPSDRDGAAQFHTNYFVVVGPGTVFRDEGKTYPFGMAIREGLQLVPREIPLLRAPGSNVIGQIPRPSETILFVESKGQGINWMEPRDLTLADMSFILNDPNAPSISSRHRHPHIAMVDGTRRTAEGIDPEQLRRMCLIDPDKMPEKKEEGKQINH